MTCVAPFSEMIFWVSARIVEAVLACSEANPLCTSTASGTPGKSVLSRFSLKNLRSVRSDILCAATTAAAAGGGEHGARRRQRCMFHGLPQALLGTVAELPDRDDERGTHKAVGSVPSCETTTEFWSGQYPTKTGRCPSGQRRGSEHPAQKRQKEKKLGHAQSCTAFPSPPVSVGWNPGSASHASPHVQFTILSDGQYAARANCVNGAKLAKSGPETAAAARRVFDIGSATALVAARPRAIREAV